MNRHTAFLTNLSILVVDDDYTQLEMLKEFINLHGGLAYTSQLMSKAIDLVEDYQFDVMVSDIMLAEGTGFDLMDQAKNVDPCLTTILVGGKSVDEFIPLIIKKNAYAFIAKPYEMLSLGLLLLQASKNTRNLRRNIYVANHLREKLNKIQIERDKIFLNTLLSLSNALEQKDEYTRNHSEMVGAISEQICLEYSNDEDFLEAVVIAGKLHDLGKIGIKDDILFKRGPLSPEEYEIIKKHPEMSYKIVKPVDNEGRIASYILHHHERWDGDGYPHKLKETGIPVGARILAVSDTFNALTSNRPYRESKDVNFALGVLHDGASMQFDPEIVEILHRLVRLGKVTGSV